MRYFGENEQPMKFLSLFLFFLCAIQCQSYGQSDAIASFVEEYGEGKKYYVYQSVIRVLNVQGDEDFNQLIRHVRRIVVHQPNVASDSTGVNKAAVRKLVSQLEEEAFEPLIEARESQMRITFYSRGTIDEAEFVLIMREQSRVFIAEVEGTLNMQYIGALANADISKLTDYLK